MVYNSGVGTGGRSMGWYTPVKIDFYTEFCSPHHSMHMLYHWRTCEIVIERGVQNVLEAWEAGASIPLTPHFEASSYAAV